MIVGETRTIQHQETAQANFVVATNPAPSYTFTDPQGSIVSSGTAVVTPGAPALIQVLSGSVSPVSGGRHIAKWQFTVGSEKYIRMENYWAYYSDVPGVVRRRLQNDYTIIPDADIDTEFAIMVRKLNDTYVGLSTAGGYGTLANEDQYRMDDGIGLLVAAKIHAFKPARQATGDITGVKIGQQIEYKFQVPTSRHPMTLEEQWIQEASEILGRVSAIQAQIAAAVSKFNIFTVTGPLRQRYDRGIRDTLVTQLVTLLNDNTFWGWT